mgnify:FL=1
MVLNVSNNSVFDQKRATLVREMPARLEPLITAQEVEAEKLVGWVQLVGVGSWAMLCLIAPRPVAAPMSMLVVPVPLARFG